MTSSSLYRASWLGTSVVGVAICAAATFAGNGPEAKFLAENEVAMNKMMAGMASPASGDIDRDFVNMMVPHHQGAIDMARAELRYGRNEKLRRIAQEIVIDQLQEIQAMRGAVGEPLKTPADAFDEPKSGNGSKPTQGMP